MRNGLSIIARDEETEVKTAKGDIAALVVKNLGSIASTFYPVVAPIVSEQVSTIIPGQKLDRLVVFFKVLEDRVKYVEQDVLRQKVQSEEFADMFEDALNQASRALSDERKEYIASLLKNSLTDEDLTHIEKKQLLSVLNELNDVEILLLKFHSLHIEQSRVFWERHKDVLQGDLVVFGASQTVVDRDAFRASYENHLQRLGLISAKYNKPKKGESPEFDKRTGMLKASHKEATTLGRLLLRFIDQEETET